VFEQSIRGSRHRSWSVALRTISSETPVAAVPCLYTNTGYMYIMLQNTRENIRRRTNRIAGQITGIQRMIEEDRYCVDILNQISAVRSALDSLGVELLTSHLQTCVIGQDAKHQKAKPMQPAELVNELHHVLSRFLK
jgi:DNA-binding FrmR family transcriptional regulator